MQFFTRAKVSYRVNNLFLFIPQDYTHLSLLHNAKQSSTANIGNCSDCLADNILTLQVEECIWNNSQPSPKKRCKLCVQVGCKASMRRVLFDLQQAAEDAAGIYFETANKMPPSVAAEAVLKTLMQTAFLGNFSCSRGRGFINVRLTPDKAALLVTEDGRPATFGNPGYLSSGRILHQQRLVTSSCRLRGVAIGFSFYEWHGFFCADHLPEDASLLRNAEGENPLLAKLKAAAR